MTVWPIAELLPHAGEMILLDAVLEHGSEHAVCSRRVPTAGLFHDADGSLPAWMGVELMAQAIDDCPLRREDRRARMARDGSDPAQHVIDEAVVRLHLP